MENRYLCRAKRLDNGEWIIGYVVFYGEDADIIQTERDGTTWRWYKVDKRTICRCTGIKDENGNLIWENDIVKRISNDGTVLCLSKIVWGNGNSFALGWNIQDIKCLNEFYDKLFTLGFTEKPTYYVCEVVGNVFDTRPELLEV